MSDMPGENSDGGQSDNGAVWTEAMKDVEYSGATGDTERTSDNGTEAATETTESKAENERGEVDPFWKEHPDLLAQAEELGAPLTVKEFKEQGYRFGKGYAGRPEVLAPTAEYAEWLNHAPEERGNFNGKMREYPGEIRLRNLVAERVAEAEKRAERRAAEAEKRREKRDTEVLNRLGEARDLFPLLSENSLDDIAWDLERRDLPKNKINIVRTQVADLVNEYLEKRTRAIENYELANRAYKRVYVGSLAEDSTDEPSRQSVQNVLYESINSSEDLRAKNRVEGYEEDGWRYRKVFKYEYLSPKIAQEVLKRGQGVVLDKVIDEQIDGLSSKKITSLKRSAVDQAISRGEFLPKTIVDNPEKADELLQELGIDKRKDRVTWEAIGGYQHIDNEDGRVAFAEFFDLDNRIAEMIENPGDEDIRFVRFGGDVLARRIQRGLRWTNEVIPGKITRTAMEKVERVQQEMTERLRTNSELAEALSKVGEEVAEASKEELIRDILRRSGSGFNFGRCLDTKSLSLEHGQMGVIQGFVNNACTEIGAIGDCIDKRSICEELVDKDATTEVNYTEAIRAGLLGRLRAGVGETYAGKNTYLTDIFETKSFKENQERIGIDFTDPGVAELAFTGFLNTLGTPNGEKSEQADWYYENIFANDPVKFLSMVAAYKNSKDGKRGIKAKLTKFFNNNPQAFADKAKQEAEKRFQEELNSERHALKTSVLRDARREEIGKIVDDYKKELVTRIKNSGAEELHIFTGVRTLKGEQEETGSEDRKEIPFDFGIEKVDSMMAFADRIKEMVPGSNVQYFVESFPQKDGKDTFDYDDAYMGFWFEYEGKLCLMAETLNPSGAMYLWRGGLGDNFRELFNYARFDAQRTDDPRIAYLRHLDPEHFEESLDESRQKAFMFFRTGDKDAVFYKSEGGRGKWEQRQAAEFPAWPMEVSQDVNNYQEGLAGYQAWQQRQAEIQDRLKTAMELGGKEAVKDELAKIAEEDYMAMYEGRR